MGTTTVNAEAVEQIISGVDQEAAALGFDLDAPITYSDSPTTLRELVAIIKLNTIATTLIGLAKKTWEDEMRTPVQMFCPLCMTPSRPYAETDEVFICNSGHIFSVAFAEG